MFSFFFRKKRIPELFWHTDIHSHVCPGIDDGSRSREESVRLVTEMEELGFRRMIVTPHVADEIFPNSPGTIARAFYSLTKGCSEAGLSMRFDYSAEYRMDELFRSNLSAGRLRPLPGGGHILVECGWTAPPCDLDRIVYTLRNDHNLIPVLAHPERYPYFQRHPHTYRHLHDIGMLFQLNLLSLAGHYDKECRRTAEALLEAGLADFIGSDLHRQSHILSIRRYLASSAYKRLENRQHLILNDAIGE